MNIGTLLPRHARYRPDHLALVVGDERLTFRQLNARVNQLAKRAPREGLRKGDKVATILPNCLGGGKTQDIPLPRPCSRSRSSSVLDGAARGASAGEGGRKGG